jgi:hypothetical protein
MIARTVQWQATDWTIEVRFLLGEWVSLLSTHLQTDCGAHLASYPRVRGEGALRLTSQFRLV